MASKLRCHPASPWQAGVQGRMGMLQDGPRLICVLRQPCPLHCPPLSIGRGQDWPGDQRGKRAGGKRSCGQRRRLRFEALASSSQYHAPSRHPLSLCLSFPLCKRQKPIGPPLPEEADRGWQSPTTQASPRATGRLPRTSSPTARGCTFDKRHQEINHPGRARPRPLTFQLNTSL